MGLQVGRSRLYTGDALRRIVQEVLCAVDVPDEDAGYVADALVAADQRGIYSHGLIRLPLYVAALQSGGMNPRPELRWRQERGATAVLDADSAIGHLAMRAAVQRAIDLAGRYGTASVAVERSTHYGAGNYWSDQLTSAGLLGIITSTTGPVVAPYGGSRTILGTNPLTIAAPSSGEHPLIVDMATSAGAYGKILAARDAGEPIPPGWAVGPDGEPTTDAAVAADGALIPFGGPKGSALAVLLEALAASLTQANYAFETTDIWVDPGHQMNTGHLIVAINPQFFTGTDHTRQRVHALQQQVRDSGGAQVQAPGDPEMNRTLAQGDRIELAEAACVELDDLVLRLGLTPPAPLEPEVGLQV